jgi:Holliday junction resolvase RusA-like endonuclease
MAQILAMFRVDGRPRTKGSLKATCTRNRSHTIRYQEETKDSSRWRRTVALACQRHQKAMWGKLLGRECAVEVRLVVYFDRQLSVAQGAPVGTVIPSHLGPLPTDIHLGDTDKLARNVGDALTDSGIIRDDSQITDFMVAKRWASPEHPAGVEVLVMEVEVAAPPYWMADGIDRS